MAGELGDFSAVIRLVFDKKAGDDTKKSIKEAKDETNKFGDSFGKQSQKILGNIFKMSAAFFILKSSISTTFGLAAQRIAAFQGGLSPKIFNDYVSTFKSLGFGEEAASIAKSIGGIQTAMDNLSSGRSEQFTKIAQNIGLINAKAGGEASIDVLGFQRAAPQQRISQLERAYRSVPLASESGRQISELINEIAPGLGSALVAARSSTGGQTLSSRFQNISATGLSSAALQKATDTSVKTSEARAKAEQSFQDLLSSTLTLLQPVLTKLVDILNKLSPTLSKIIDFGGDVVKGAVDFGANAVKGVGDAVGAVAKNVFGAGPGWNTISPDIQKRINESIANIKNLPSSIGTDWPAAVAKALQFSNPELAKDRAAGFARVSDYYKNTPEPLPSLPDLYSRVRSAVSENNVNLNITTNGEGALRAFVEANPDLFRSKNLRQSEIDLATAVIQLANDKSGKK